MHAFIVLMALGIVVLDVAFVVSVIALFNAKWRGIIRSFAQEYGMLGIFLLSAGSIFGTLLMQYAALLTPCVLCWWQRIFMYPIALISLIALIKGKRMYDIADYVIVFSILGGAISLYQHLLQILPSGSLIPCDSSGDCAVRLVFEFGFVTIPWMALTVFAALALIAFLARKEPAV
jgi:disulfide bond formation protein DsbB